MSANLYRRPSGIYAVRIVVPRRLRAAVGRTEIHASTGHRDLDAAKLAGLQIELAWRQRLMDLDRKKLEQPNPLLLTDGLIGLREAAAATSIPLPGLLGELLNDRATLFIQAQGWQGWWVPDIYEIERDYDETFVENDVVNKGLRKSLFGLAQPYDSGSTLATLNSTAASVSLFRLQGNAAFFTDAPQSIEATSCFVKKTAVERIRARLAAKLPPLPEKSLTGSVTEPERPATPVIFDPITARHGKKRFSQLFELYRDDRDWREEQRRRMTTEAGLFAELMGDPELATIERETILEFAKRLATLPSDIYQSKRRYKVHSLSELITIGRIHGLELKNEATVKRHVGHISEILNYGLKNNMMRFNPAADFKRRKGSKKTTTARSERDVFDQDDLARIFSAEWFISGAGRFEAGGRWTDWRPFNYWLPMMGLLTGGRINELAQLYLDDIAQAETGIWYFDFNLDQPDKSDMDTSERDKSLKTINAERIVPMHDLLVRLGLPDYVAALRKAGYLRLFPELSRDRVKGYGKAAGSWFNERFLGNKLGMERNGRKVFHSFRHVFATALERLDAPESVRAQLAGHQRGLTESGIRYAKDRSAQELHELVNRLHFDCLDKIAPFNIPAGLRAVSIAAKLKKANARRTLLKEEFGDPTT